MATTEQIHAATTHTTTFLTSQIGGQLRRWARSTRHPRTCGLVGITGEATELDQDVRAMTTHAERTILLADPTLTYETWQPIAAAIVEREHMVDAAITASGMDQSDKDAHLAHLAAQRHSEEPSPAEAAVEAAAVEVLARAFAYGAASAALVHAEADPDVGPAVLAGMAERADVACARLVEAVGAQRVAALPGAIDAEARATNAALAAAMVARVRAGR